jgi:hypothetical protein
VVHGAWADGAGSKGVYDILVKDGYNVSYNVSIVQEPQTSGFAYLDPAQFHEYFAADLSAEQAAFTEEP